MGRGCRYCTLWADGFNGVYPHLADRAAFVVCSPDPVETQRELATGRGWRFPMVSRRESSFTQDMGFRTEEGWMPGASTFHREPTGGIVRVAKTPFGPFDYCSIWHLFRTPGRGRERLGAAGPLRVGGARGASGGGSPAPPASRLRSGTP